MAQCNIKKYDNLPGRVGWTDVDALRFGLDNIKRKIEYWKEQEKEIIKRLEKARKEYNK